MLIISFMATLGHAMQRPDKQPTEDWESEEDELLKKMAGIRLEQAKKELRKLQASDEKAINPNKTTPEFIHELRKYKKELTEKEKVVGEKPFFFIIRSPSADCIAQHKDDGYLVFEYCDGITGFCLPGHEQELKAHAEKLRDNQ